MKKILLSLLFCGVLAGCSTTPATFKSLDEPIDHLKCVPGLVHPEYSEKNGYKEIFTAKTFISKVVIVENQERERIAVLKSFFINAKTCVVYDSYPVIVFGPKL